MARGDKTVMLTARITDEQEDFLKELGDGSRTKGLEELLNRSMGGGAPQTKPEPIPTFRPTMKRTQSAPVKPAPVAAVTRRFIGKR